MTKPLYVGSKEFASYKEAQAFCEANNLSPTLIHETPYRSKRRGL